MHVTVDGNLSVRESHAITEQIEERVRVILPGSDVTVHVEPHAEPSGTAATAESAAAPAE